MLEDFADEDTIIPNTEFIHKDLPNRTEYQFFNKSLEPIHRSRIVYKNQPKIIVFPFNYNEVVGITKKRISEIEFRGWTEYENLPKLIKPGERISLGNKKIAPLMRMLYSKYPDLHKLVIIKTGGSTRFSNTTATLTLSDLEKVCGTINKENKTFETRRKTVVQNSLSNISRVFTPTKINLPRGDLAHFLSLYNGDFTLSLADTDSVLGLVGRIPLGNVTVTENFIETKNKINVAYLDKIIQEYEALLDVQGDNEKDWQEFFDEYAWLMASIFPYQVVLHKKEAYVGGKTIENNEGRVVDFLFQNDFRDNYALLEVKTHNKQILKSTPYREPDAFSQHPDCSGAIAQCLDQKNTFLTEMGLKYPSLDPRCILIIGQKRLLNDPQRKSFELLRSNQKNIDIVTFDEVLSKLYGLRSILNTKE